MKKSPYMPRDDEGKAPWLTQLAATLPQYQAAIGVSAAEVTAIQADSAFFSYACTAQKQVAAYAQQWTAYKNSARSGKTPVLGLAPIAPVLTPAPAVAPGIFIRAAALVARIKKHPGYTEAIGQALQIIGADQAMDLAALKPVLRLTTDAGGVTVAWLKQGMDGVELHVDRGTGFGFLAFDTVPDYQDSQVVPVGTSALWKYKAIYRLSDERVGQWSDVVSVAVAG